MYGLKEETIQRICGVISKYPNIEKVLLYGSRAKGNYRDGSDIDLTIIGEEMSLTDLGKLEWELEELLLPYKIDLSLFHQISNPSLIEHIERVGKTFWINALQRKPSTDQ